MRILISSFFLLATLCHSQGEGGVFTANRLAALKTGEGALGNNPHAIQWVNELRARTGALGQGETIRLDDIEGSVYFNSEFVSGTIFYLNEPYQTFPLRYDAYNDEVEIKRGAGDDLEALHKNQAISCEISGKKLEYHQFVDNRGNINKGYLFSIYKGKEYALYQRRNKKFKEGKKAKTSLQNSFPHRFVDDTEFYIQKKNKNPIFFKPSKSEVSNLFENANSSKIKKHIKTNRLDLDNESDLRKIFVFAEANHK